MHDNDTNNKFSYIPRLYDSITPTPGKTYIPFANALTPTDLQTRDNMERLYKAPGHSYLRP